MRGQLTTFALHTYLETGMSPGSVDAALARLHRLAAAGYQIVANINDINHHGPPAPTSTFLALVRHVIDTAGSWLSAVEITNEPNFPDPNTSDGLAPNVITDVVQGVLIARREASAHHDALQVGFSYVYSFDLPNDLIFWTELKAAATPEFLHAIDFIGLHTYPTGTLDISVTGLYDYFEQQGLATGRCWMTWLGLPPTLPIDITEIGYPTHSGSSEYGDQAGFWARVLPYVNAVRATYGVRSLYAFLLQDPPNTSQFGLFDSAGQPKPAAYTVAQLFARFGVLKASSPTPSHHHRRRRRRHHRRRRGRHGPSRFAIRRGSEYRPAE